MAEKKYDKKYDSYYDPVTNDWIEKKCSDPDCWFCRERPDRHVTDSIFYIDQLINGG